MRKIFEKYKKISRKTNKILGSLKQISEKFVGNIWLIFLQLRNFQSFTYSLIITWKKLKKIFAESLEKIWENFN